jgi:hypothetical protein
MTCYVVVAVGTEVRGFHLECDLNLQAISGLRSSEPSGVALSPTTDPNHKTQGSHHLTPRRLGHAGGRLELLLPHHGHLFGPSPRLPYRREDSATTSWNILPHSSKPHTAKIVTMLHHTANGSASHDHQSTDTSTHYIIVYLD